MKCFHWKPPCKSPYRGTLRQDGLKELLTLFFTFQKEVSNRLKVEKIQNFIDILRTLKSFLESFKESLKAALKFAFNAKHTLSGVGERGWVHTKLKCTNALLVQKLFCSESMNKWQFSLNSLKSSSNYRQAPKKQKLKLLRDGTFVHKAICDRLIYLSFSFQFKKKLN